MKCSRDQAGWGWTGRRLLAMGVLALVPWVFPARGEITSPDADRAKALAGIKVPTGFRYEILVQGGIPEPVYLQFSPDGRLWFTGRRGDIWAYDFVSKKADRVGEVKAFWEPTPGRESNERGLHGIAFDPGYRTNGYLYLHYAPTPESQTWSNRVSRFTVDSPVRATGLVPGSEKVLLEIPSTKGFHQGGAVEYNPFDGKLWVTVGDNNVSSDTEKFYQDSLNPPQVLSDLRGKVLRLNLDGSIPEDNPFRTRVGAHPAVYSYGHRNPYSMNLDGPTGRVYVGEVGYDRKEDFEEINWIKPGGNYGWPRCIGPNRGTYGGDCPLPDAVPPWIFWEHDTGANATSGPLYRPVAGTTNFPTRFHGGMFYGDFTRKWIRFAPVDPADNTAGKTEPFARGFTGGPLAMKEGPDGALYFVEYSGWFTGTAQDKLSRIVWTGEPTP
jgi:glucose/arabinose dehydrogenase